jgi:hypothetical protein
MSVSDNPALFAAADIFQSRHAFAGTNTKK